MLFYTLFRVFRFVKQEPGEAKTRNVGSYMRGFTVCIRNVGSYMRGFTVCIRNVGSHMRGFTVCIRNVPAKKFTYNLKNMSSELPNNHQLSLIVGLSKHERLKYLYYT